MTPQELKNSILQLAIQGKLVEQRPEEGTAEELYKQIQQEKQSLINAKLIKDEQITTEPDNVPFDIPSTWKWVRITDCGFFISGFTPKENELSTAGIVPYFKVSDMNTKGNELWLNITRAFLRDPNTQKYFLKNTIVYPKNGGAVFTNKKRILSQNSVVDLNTGGYSVIGPISIMYFYYFFSLIDFKQCFKGTALPTIDMEKLKKRWVPLPPLAEQKRIVAKIEELLPLIDRYEKAWNRLEEFNKRFPDDMKKSLLQLAIQGKLVEQRPEEGTGDELYLQILKEKQALIKAGKIKKEKPLPEITEVEIPFEIPERWKWARTGNIGSWSAGATPPRTNADYYNGSIPWLKTGDLNDGYVSNVPEFISTLALEKTSVRLNPVGSVLMAMYGATIGKLGILSIPMTTNQACCSCIPYTGIYNKYIFYFLMAMRKAFIKMGEGGAQPNISKEKIVNSPIPIPPLAEQKRIVAKLEELLPLCEKMKGKR